MFCTIFCFFKLISDNKPKAPNNSLVVSFLYIDTFLVS